MASAHAFVVAAGENISFEVALKTKPDNFVWLKDDKPLDQDAVMTGRIQISHCDETNHYKIDINKANVEDSGYNTALATGTHGTASCSALLIVHESTNLRIRRTLF